MNSLLIFLFTLLVILLFTAKFKIHPFLSLITASILVGILAQEPIAAIDSISTGMGKVFSHFAIVITAGSIIGTVLHRTGATSVIAEDVITLSKKPLIALNLLGFVFAVPLMCCILAYVVFIPLAKEIRTKLQLPKGLAATTLVLGTLASYNLIYPSPVIFSAAGELGISSREIMLPGIAIALIVSFVGYLYASKVCNFTDMSDFLNDREEIRKERGSKPGRIDSYSPLMIPIILILAEVFTSFEVLDFLGNPNIALLIGVALSVILPGRYFDFSDVRAWIEKAIKRSGVVLLDMCGGGALGATLLMVGAGEDLGNMMLGISIPSILVPFLIAVAIQSVQGSRVVTMLVAPSLVIPILPQLGLPAVIVLFSMASGTFLISHFNDPFFWIFGDLAEMKPMEVLRSYTVGGIIMGMVSIALTTIAYIAFY
jgi:GntP family gluconate:H+ symporter